MRKIIHKELSGVIIGAAMEVLNELKPGLDEKLYERAMTIELQRCGHRVSAQSSYPVFYRGELIGDLIPDLIVDDSVIVDPKVVTVFYRSARCSNARLLKHHRAGFGAAYEFCEFTAGMETRVAPA